VDEVRHAVEQRIQVLAEMSREQERLGDRLQDFLLGLGVGQVRIEEVLLGMARRFLQIVDPVGPDRLHDVWTDCLQEHVSFLLFKEKLCCAHGVIRLKLL
jgi:hypothetical protein